MRTLSTFLLLAVILAGAPAWAANEFGVVELTAGEATVLDAGGKASKPKKGQVVHEGATLMTGADGELHVATRDNGLIALRPNTRLKVEAFRAKKDKSDKMTLLLQEGRFRSITGWIARDRPKAYRIKTVTATIGVRGTDHEPAYVAPDTKGAEPGTYDKVNKGETYIENRKGRVVVKPKQSGFASDRAIAPAILANVPLFYKPTRFESQILRRAGELNRLLDAPQEIERWKEEPKEQIRRSIPKSGYGGW